MLARCGKNEVDVWISVLERRLEEGTPKDHPALIVSRLNRQNRERDLILSDPSHFVSPRARPGAVPTPPSPLPAVDAAVTFHHCRCPEPIHPPPSRTSCERRPTIAAQGALLTSAWHRTTGRRLGFRLCRAPSVVRRSWSSFVVPDPRFLGPFSSNAGLMKEM